MYVCVSDFPKVFGRNINNRLGPIPGSAIWKPENINNRFERFCTITVLLEEKR